MAFLFANSIVFVIEAAAKIGTASRVLRLSIVEKLGSKLGSRRFLRMSSPVKKVMSDEREILPSEIRGSLYVTLHSAVMIADAISAIRSQSRSLGA